jgi:shikimate dehydrogenase
MMKIKGTTRVCGLFGYPVQHSFSPAMHNAAFSYLGLDYVYVPFLVAPDRLEQAVNAIRALNLSGVNVTVPHKEKVISFLDELMPEARLVGAVNVIVNNHGQLTGHNTDGAGFLRALKSETGFLPEGRDVLVLGAGGAARAVSVSLALAGAREICIANRTAQRAEELARELNRSTPARAKAVLWSEQDLIKVIERVSLIIQATSVGMHPGEEVCPSFPFQHLQKGQVVCDLIYNPPRTKFLEQAQATGSTAFNGLGMLFHQGALAFELWTGVRAPEEIMYQALFTAFSKAMIEKDQKGR